MVNGFDSDRFRVESYIYKMQLKYFGAENFLHITNRANASKILSRLKQEGVLNRVAIGVYELNDRSNYG